MFRFLPIFFFFAALLFISGCSVKDPSMMNTILNEATFEVYNEEFYDYIAKQTEIVIIASGHEWTEGPVWIESEKMLLYSDIPNNAIYSWKENETAKLYLETAGGSSISNEGSNGLFLKGDTLILCQHGARQIAYMNATISNPSNSFVSIVSTYERARLNSPNDLTFSNDGDLFFTDPPYGLRNQDEDTSKQLPFNGIYRYQENGNLILLNKEFSRPNGIALTNNEQTLIVSNSDRKAAYWASFEIDDYGNLANEKIIYDATTLVGNENPGLPDGLKIHSSGAIFATGPGGLFIFNSVYELLGIIKTGRAIANIAFDTYEKNAYLTADDLVLRVPLVHH